MRRFEPRAGFEGECEFQPPGGVTEDARLVLGAGVAGDEFPDHADIAGHTRGEPARDDVQMGAVEELQRDALEDQQRQQDDEQRAPEQAAWGDESEKAFEAHGWASG